MAIHYNSKIVTDGLVFAYDMGNTNKSWKGAPTTNLVSDPFALSGNPSLFGWGGLEATCTRTNVLPHVSMKSISEYWMKVELTNGGGTGRVSTISLSGLTVGVDYCVSAYVYSNDSNISNVRINSHNAGSSTDISKVSYGLADVGTIKRIETVFRSVAGGQLEVLQMTSASIVGTTFYITGVQIEQQSFPTPVVNGTRSNTQAIVDMVGGGATVNPTNIIYNADGSFSFNGSTSYSYNSWPGSLNVVDNTTPRSWECWIKPMSTGQQAIFGHKAGAGCSYYCNGGLYIYGGKACFNWYDNSAYRFMVGTTSISSGNVYHIVGTFDTDRKPRLYVNGQLEATFSSATNLLYSAGMVTFEIGYGSKNGGRDYFNGDIYKVAFYKNKALSLNEVNENFNALRGRYGI